MSAAASTGSCRHLRRRRSRVAVLRVSGGSEVALRCSTCCWRGQSERELVGWRVASDVHDVHTRDTSGILASSGRAISGEATASTSTWPLLGDVEERGGVVGQGGQGSG
jgi:hypothetical protein